MKKYYGFYWVIDGSGWRISDTLEEAKDIFCFGMRIFEINAEDEQELKDYFNKVRSNKTMLNKMTTDGYPLIHSEGEIYDWHLQK